MHWLSKHLPLARQPMHMGIVEATKLAVASGIGMSIVPDVAVAKPSAEIVVRPLKPALPCTLGLVERRNKPSEPALEIVRDALLTLKTFGETAPPRRHRGTATVPSKKSGKRPSR
jgi:DNA-binding transcriptional LysR family regulator